MKIILVLFSILFFSCTQNNNTQNKQNAVDSVENKIEPPQKIERIISGAPSNTEIIIALGLADKLVAVDKYSFDVEGVPDVPKIDFFNPDAEVIIKLIPDIIITNMDTQTGHFRVLSELGISVVSIPMSASIDDIYKDIEFISKLLNVEDAGAKIINDTKSTLNNISEIGGKVGEQSRKRIYFEISPFPSIATFGGQTYLNDMIEIIGAENIFASSHGIIFPNEEAIINRNPDIIITDINYTDDPIGEIKNRPGFQIINAVKNNDVYYVDTNSASRPTHNIVKAVRQMAEVVYPEFYKIDGNESK